MDKRAINKLVAEFDTDRQKAEMFIRWYWANHPEHSPTRFQHWNSEYIYLRTEKPDEWTRFTVLYRMGIDLPVDDFENFPDGESGKYEIMTNPWGKTQT